MEIDKNILIDLLEEYANLLELKRENQFKVAAYRKAANAIRQYEGDFIKDYKENNLKEIKGIGEAIRHFIDEAIKIGYPSQLEKLRKSFPEGLFDLFKIKGLGPAKIYALYTELGIDSLGALKLACERGAIANLKGFSEKTQKEILDQILKLENAKKALLLPEALAFRDKFLSYFRAIYPEEIFAETGKLRRLSESFESLEFITTKKYDESFVEMAKNFGLSNFSYNGNFEMRFDSVNCRVSLLNCLFNDEIEFVIYIVDRSNYRFCEFILSCDVNFLKKLKLTETFQSDREVFELNGLPYILPEAREEGTLSLNENLLIGEPIKEEDLKGLIHFHTNYSDGKNTLQEMIGAAAKLGYEYCVVCDHSKSAFYAQGLDEKKVERQRELIAELSKNYKILSGIESDILSDGSLDYDEDFLSTFDFVVASIHSRFGMSEEEMTARIVKAVENLYTDALGHMSGRLLLTRQPYKINSEKIIDACVANNVAIEINSTPFRLDLDWRLLYYARNKGAKFIIAPDAHSIEEISNNRYGIMMARKALVSKNEILNAMSLENFVNFLNSKRKRKITLNK